MTLEAVLEKAFNKPCNYLEVSSKMVVESVKRVMLLVL